MELKENGVTVIPLSTLVNRYCLKTGNTKQQHYLRYLEMARWAWKELFRRTIWEIKTAVLPVCPNTGKIIIPDDCERLVNISVIDINNQLHPLSYNPDINTAKILCQKTACSCKRCNGHDTLCEAVDNITMKTETVTIQGTDYTMRIWIRYGNGALQTEKSIPVYNTQTNSVVYETQMETLCNLDIDSNGCILPTLPNREALQLYAGYGFMANNGYGAGLADGFMYTGNPYRENIPTPYNFFGYWNWDAAQGNCIHIYHNKVGNRMYVNCEVPAEDLQCGNAISKVIMTYQTNGESPGEEILVPEYAEMAVDRGIIFQIKALSPTGDRGMESEKAWRREQRLVMAHLNPIRIDDILKIQTQARPW